MQSMLTTFVNGLKKVNEFLAVYGTYFIVGFVIALILTSCGL